MKPADDVERIQREMTVFARRARAAAGRMHPELSLVSYTLLGHLEESGGCRATDLAAHYALDKSTVSRQVAALERAGLIQRRPDAEDQRVLVLHLTEAGRRILAQVTESRRAAFRERLAGLAGRGPGAIRRLPRALQRGPCSRPRRPGPTARTPD
ncbi:putative HTH-type transcriptional regulator YxaD [Streptomyces afghaniensis 772] [Streptomyces afghaniensis]